MIIPRTIRLARTIAVTLAFGHVGEAVAASPLLAQVTGSGSPAPAPRSERCAASPYREFDFWLGDWDVYDAQGTLVGQNLVTREQDGCLLVEHWTARRGGETGTSFNYYDVRDQRWHQLYIDNSGNAGAYPAMAGRLDNGRMVMLTPDTNDAFSRWTWFVVSPGKVRQMAERSQDHGGTWQTTWFSTYVRKGEKP